MQKQPDKAPIKNLRDAYRVRGFHVRAQLDGCEHEPPAVVLTLDRRSKKPSAAGAGSCAAAVTINVADGCAIWSAAPMSGLPGRPPSYRHTLSRAFVAKAALGLPQTKLLIERLKVDKVLRRCAVGRAQGR